MTDEKGKTPECQVSSRSEFLVANCSMPARRVLVKIIKDVGSRGTFRAHFVVFSWFTVLS